MRRCLRSCNSSSSNSSRALTEAFARTAVEAVMGFWPHSLEMTPTQCLPVALERLGLIGPILPEG